jgi:molybdopterin converting factor small subunit|tara:strand:+ start:4988 stop:5251 length:264 start_codon:yes stop_codon:yes gene_type:complete
MSSSDKATFPVRVNGKLAEELGTSRLSVEVAEPATIQDILDEINSRYPGSSGTILEAIPFSSGNHRGAGEEVQSGQEVTLLMPAAGG